MAFIAIDINVEAAWYSQVAGWGFDLICARPGEMDHEFIQRAIDHDAIAFLSRDMDIQNLLDSRFDSDTPVFSSPEKMKLRLFGEAKRKTFL